MFPYETLLLRKRLSVTRSASSFCRNPLYFLAYAIWVKWWYHANFQPFQSSFEMIFNFRVLYLKIFSKCMKNNKWRQKGLKIDDVGLNGAFWAQKNYAVQISSKKMKSLCYRQVSIWNPDTSKEIVRFVHEVHPVFAVTLSSFLHMLCGWNDDTMPSFVLFRVHLKWFSISGSYSSKYSVNAWKITNEVRKGWKLMMWLWMVNFEHRKTMEFK